MEINAGRVGFGTVKVTAINGGLSGRPPAKDVTLNHRRIITEKKRAGVVSLTENLLISNQSAWNIYQRKEREVNNSLRRCRATAINIFGWQHCTVGLNLIWHKTLSKVLTTCSRLITIRTVSYQRYSSIKRFAVNTLGFFISVYKLNTGMEWFQFIWRVQFTIFVCRLFVWNDWLINQKYFC